MLWRGTRHWFSRGSGGGSSTSGPSEVPTAKLRFGELELSVSFDVIASRATVLSKTVPLGEGANVLLVDGVDGPERTVQVLRIDPTLPEGARQFERLLQRSETVIAFLGCDRISPDAPFLDRLLCERIQGK